jgi:hypothetical protein
MKVYIPAFIKNKFISYLLISTPQNGQPNILLVWVTTWDTEGFVVHMQILIILFHNLSDLCELSSSPNFCETDNKLKRNMEERLNTE